MSRKKKQAEDSPVGFGSGNYTSRDQFSDNTNTASWCDRVKKEDALYKKNHKNELENVDLNAKTHPLAQFVKEGAEASTEPQSETSAYDAAHALKKHAPNKFCAKCKLDTNHCKHLEQHKQTTPKDKYRSPVTHGHQYGWREPIDPVDKTHTIRYL